MKTSAIGKAALISREGVKTRAYRDSVGVWTIGVGHTAGAGAPIPKAGMKISYAEALSLFDRDIVKYENPVNEAFQGIELTQHQFDALVSICYNIGEGWFTGRRKGGTASFVKNIKVLNFKKAAINIMKFTEPKEITTRREAERDQFVTPYETRLPKGRSNDASTVKVNVPITFEQRTSISPPVTESVSTAISTTTFAGQLAKLWAWATNYRKPNVIRAYEPPPGFKGNMNVYKVQVELRAKGYTEVGKLDGFRGEDTDGALRSFILDNGDDLNKTQGLYKYDYTTLSYVVTGKPKKVDPSRAFADTRDVAHNAPEVIAPVNSLVRIGLSGLGLGGLVETLQSVRDAADSASQTADAAQSAIAQAKPVLDVLGPFFGFMGRNPGLILAGFGLFALIIVTPQVGRIVQMFRDKRIN